MLSLLCGAGSGACVAASGDPGDEAAAGSQESLSLTTVTEEAPPFCLEPDEVTEDPEDLAHPPPPAELGDFAAADGPGLVFEPARPVNRLVRRVELQPGGSRTTRDTASVRLAGWTVVVQPDPVYRREVDRRIYMSSGGRAVEDVELMVTYDFRDLRDGNRQLSVGALEVVPTAGGTAADVYEPSPWFADPPSDCREEAMIAFGRFPYGMPPLDVPHIEDCNSWRCKKITTAWINLHINVWRASQVIGVLDPLHPAQRSYYWDKPGTDASGEPVSLRSSPAYWFGSYDDGRYQAIREVILEYHDNVLHSKIGGTNLQLRCPDYDQNPGNWCFTHQPIAHHVVKGKVDFCLDVWDTAGCTSVSNTLDEAMHHEPLHHVWTHLNGVNRALKDSFTHQHGDYCGIPLGVDTFYCENGNDGNNIRHLATWADGDTGTTCNHRSKNVRAVDAYALYIRVIGNMVQDGTMTHWPELADPTPTAPECVGGVGCLCDNNGVHDSPDGDYLPTKHCQDDGEPIVCMTTTFNASETVGICTRCSDHRGPGCPCNDLTNPCDEGFCFGDDTNGTDSATGTCYDDPPPSWGCLADCEALIGPGAFCMNDHPDHARCVPYGTTLPEASNCWWDGGHMDWNELECTFQEECITTQDCADLGYPPTHVCNATLRCVPDL